MRVCVLYADQPSAKICKELAGALAKGIESQGHFVDLIEIGQNKGKTLTTYDYIVLGATPTSFFSKSFDNKVSTFLKQNGNVGGKRSFAFIPNKGLRKTKSLQNLMMIMEKEGMFVTFSEVIKSVSEAKLIGSQLLIK